MPNLPEEMPIFAAHPDTVEFIRTHKPRLFEFLDFIRDLSLESGKLVALNESAKSLGRAYNEDYEWHKKMLGLQGEKK